MNGRIAAAGVAGIFLATAAGAYPIDAYEETGIARLEAFRLAQEGEIPGIVLYQGAQLYSPEIGLRLTRHPDFEIPEPDPEFTQAVVEVLGEDAKGYNIALLDITDPDNPVYAEINPEQKQNPGSVGKVMVGLAWFQALADVYPNDLETRKRLLYETELSADEFIKNDHHEVPFWSPGDPKYVRRKIQIGDTGNLNTWMDWMLSSSSNAAAAELQSEAMLLKAKGTAYPVSKEEKAAYFKNTPKRELTRNFMDVMVGSATRNGLDSAKLRQGSFFSRTGKGRVPGTSSYATAPELLKYMVLMEKGELVDRWSSEQLKKFLYLTDKRIRYASSPKLWDNPVYYKSGSFYGCKPEAGFTCGKYQGNRFNYMNSVALIESADEGPKVDYIAVVLSNVLRKNSAVEHQALAGRIHQLIEARHPEPVEIEIDDLPWLDPA